MLKYKTEQREQLLHFLTEHPHEIFSAKQLVSRFPDGSISQSAVYRNLNTLEKKGYIRKSAKGGSREAYYQYAQAPQCQHFLHITCLQCGDTVHGSLAISKQLSQDIFCENGFTIDPGKSVFYGYCRLCSK